MSKKIIKKEKMLTVGSKHLIHGTTPPHSYADFVASLRSSRDKSHNYMALSPECK